MVLILHGKLLLHADILNLIALYNDMKPLEFSGFIAPQSTSFQLASSF